MKKLILFLALFLVGGKSMADTYASMTINNLIGCPLSVTLHAHDACAYSGCGALQSNLITVPALGSVSYWSIRALQAPVGSPAYWIGLPNTACSGCSVATCGWDWASIWLFGTTMGPIIGNAECFGHSVLSIPMGTCTGGSATVTWYDDGTGNITITIS
jgi:hypothetical protein